MASVLLTVWLAVVSSSVAQSSFPTQVATPVAAPPVVPPWPAMAWGVAPPTGDLDVFGWPPPDTAFLDDPQQFTLGMNIAPAIDNGQLGQLGPGIAPGGWLGPMVNLAIPPPGGGIGAAAGGKAPAAEPERIQLGNVSFKRTAASLDVDKSDLAKPGDFSRQFETPIDPASVAPAVPLNSWTVMGIGGLVIIIVLAISFHQKDSRQRKRRHRHHRRHSSPGA